MYINKLEIKGFGKLKDLNFDFSRGMNLVSGNNESGKSTMQWFIKAMFYGLKGGRTFKPGMPPTIRKFAPWSGSDYGGSMEYTLDSGERFRVIRNFNTGIVKIFDSSFNDITGTFDKSRGSGVLFADRHLGLSENCFDKTVFVKQMETRIGDDGVRELVDRLGNVSRTGFEDVSFNKAQKALKEALKNFIGTEKTTVRPLDRINRRFEELKTARTLLLEKKKSLLGMDLEYNSTKSCMKELSEKKELLRRTKVILEFQGALDEDVKRMLSLKEMTESVKSLESELSEVGAAIEGLDAKESELSDYAAFGPAEADGLGLEYYGYLDLMQKKLKLETRLQELKTQKVELEKHLQERGIQTGQGTDYKRAAELSREINSLREEYEKLNMELLGEKVRAVRGRKRSRQWLTAALTVGFLVLLAVGLAGIIPAYAGACAAALASVWSAITCVRASAELTSLMGEKRSAFITSSALRNKICSDQAEMAEILNSAGVKDVEELLSLKTEYDRDLYRLDSISGEMDSLESEYRTTLLKAEEKGIAITGMLSRAGIRLERYAEIQQAHIEEFRSRAKAYSELQNDLALLRQRENGLDKSLAELFKRAVSIYGADFGSSTLLLDELGRMGRTVESRKEQLERMKTELEEDCAARGMTLPVPEFMTDENFVTQKDIVTVEYEKVEEKATELRLKTVELETLLKDRTDEGNELQEIDEEIYELEGKKVQLEDKHFSIKTALDTLTEASAEIQRDFAPVLNQKMSTAISRITGNRYADLRADDSLALKVLVPETGEVADNLMLSGGTVDQLYLALRVAMAEIIASSQEKLPFVMDEVFAQYDDQRVCNTFEFLQELSSERQVILFTCKSREEDMAARVFSGNINVLELR